MILANESLTARLQSGYFVSVGQGRAQHLVVVGIVEGTKVDDAGFLWAVDELLILGLVATFPCAMLSSAPIAGVKL